MLAIAFWRRGKGYGGTCRTEKMHSWLWRKGRKGLIRTVDVHLAVNPILCKLTQWWKADAKHSALHYNLRSKTIFLQIVWQGKKKFVISTIWALSKTNQLERKSNQKQFWGTKRQYIYVSNLAISFFHLQLSIILQDKWKLLIFTEICFYTRSPVEKGAGSLDKHLQASLISAFVFFRASLMLRLKGESRRLMTSV